MGEWKRVFLNPRWICIFVLMTAVCLALFVVSSLDQIGPKEFEYMCHTNAYINRLIRRWRDIPMYDLPVLVNAEIDKLSEFDRWYSDDLWLDSIYISENDAYATIADMPYLAEAAKSGNRYTYYRILNSYQKALRTMSDDIEYLNGYADYLDNVQKQAQIQSQVSLFRKSGSFSRRNMEKTASQFSLLQDVRVEFGNNRGITQWLDFEIGDYFHLFL